MACVIFKTSKTFASFTSQYVYKDSKLLVHMGGFQLLDLIITELQSHMTC